MTPPIPEGPSLFTARCGTSLAHFFGPLRKLASAELAVEVDCPPGRVNLNSAAWRSYFSCPTGITDRGSCPGGAPMARAISRS